LSTQINEGTLLGALWENNIAGRLICTSCLSVDLVVKLLYRVDVKTNVIPLIIMARNVRRYQQLKHTLSLKTYINSVFLLKCKVKHKNAGPLPPHILHKIYDT
jgi:hypothetical protein